MGRFYLSATLDDEDLVVVLGDLLLENDSELDFMKHFGEDGLVQDPENAAEMAQENLETALRINFARLKMFVCVGRPSALCRVPVTGRLSSG